MGHVAVLAGLFQADDAKPVHDVDSLAENQYEQRDHGPFKCDLEVGLAVVN